MAVAKRNQTFDPKIYKHFAAITLGVTALIGLFASGNDAETVAKTVAKADVGRPDMRPQQSREIASGLSSSSGKGFADAAPVETVNEIAIPAAQANASALAGGKKPRMRRKGNRFYFDNGLHPTGEVPPPGPPSAWGDYNGEPVIMAPKAPDWNKAGINLEIKASMERSGRVSNDIRR